MSISKPAANGSENSVAPKRNSRFKRLKNRVKRLLRRPNASNKIRAIKNSKLSIYNSNNTYQARANSLLKEYGKNWQNVINKKNIFGNDEKSKKILNIISTKVILKAPSSSIGPALLQAKGMPSTSLINLLKEVTNFNNGDLSITNSRRANLISALQVKSNNKNISKENRENINKAIIRLRNRRSKAERENAAAASASASANQVRANNAAALRNKRNRIATEIWNRAWGGPGGLRAAKPSNFPQIAQEIKKKLNITTLNNANALKNYMKSKNFKNKWASLTHPPGRFGGRGQGNINRSIGIINAMSKN